MADETGSNASGLTLRAAESRDAELILALVRELAEYEKLSGEVVADAERIRTALFGPRPAAEVVIAEYEGAPAGFALFFTNFSTFLGRSGIYLEDLFVRPAHRRHGIGRALLAHLAQLATARGCGRLEWAVLDWNEPAIQFYRELGARPMDEWTVFRVTDDALAALAAQSAPSTGTAHTPARL